MLSREDNECLTRTGPGTAMGALLRHYWMPVVLGGELEPGGRVKRVQLLGERLIAFRGKNGQPGLVGEFCPHRLASLYFGRVEDAGLRCVYHGWKFGLDGQCLEMPNEPPESGFASKVRHVGYPCLERGGIVWTYMGPASPPPPMSHLEWTLLPESHTFASKRVQACNWFQGLEGGIDSSHINFLHAPIDHADTGITRALDEASFGVGEAVQTADRAPRFDVVDTDYGVVIGAQRTRPDGQHYWRVTQFLMPFYTMPPTDLDQTIVQSHIWVPMDDTHVINWMVTWHPERALTREEVAVHVGGRGAHVVEYAPATSEPYGDVRTAASRDNDYGMDWEVHRTSMFCGIPGFGVQDQAIQESQGPIVDRTRERLGTSDAAIIQVRKRLLGAAKALRDAGTPAPGRNPESFRVRSASVVLPPGASWVDGAMSKIVATPGGQLTLA